MKSVNKGFLLGLLGIGLGSLALGVNEEYQKNHYWEWGITRGEGRIGLSLAKFRDNYSGTEGLMFSTLEKFFDNALVLCRKKII